MKYKSLTIDQSEKLFFTADTHFWHAKAAQMRQHANVEEMNEWQIDRLNANTGYDPSCTLIMLGDISFAGKGRTLEVLNAIKARKVLVRGNHDKGMDKDVLAVFDGVYDILKVKVRDDGHVQQIVCCHFPMLAWDMQHYGAWHLHGHSHGSCRYPNPNARILDVGVDMKAAGWNYFDIKETMDGRETWSADYHKVKV